MQRCSVSSQIIAMRIWCDRVTGEMQHRGRPTHGSSAVLTEAEKGKVATAEGKMERERGDKRKCYERTSLSTSLGASECMCECECPAGGWCSCAASMLLPASECATSTSSSC